MPRAGISEVRRADDAVLVGENREAALEAGRRAPSAMNAHHGTSSS
jgi:hypothetical protein